MEAGDRAGPLRSGEGRGLSEETVIAGAPRAPVLRWLTPRSGGHREALCRERDRPRETKAAVAEVCVGCQMAPPACPGAGSLACCAGPPGVPVRTQGRRGRGAGLAAGPRLLGAVDRVRSMPGSPAEPPGGGPSDGIQRTLIAPRVQPIADSKQEAGTGSLQRTSPRADRKKRRPRFRMSRADTRMRILSWEFFSLRSMRATSVPRYTRPRCERPVIVPGNRPSARWPAYQASRGAICTRSSPGTSERRAGLPRA